MPTEAVLKAAAAIANSRGMRRGVPPIVNILELLPANLLNEVIEEAQAALDAVMFKPSDETLTAILVSRVQDGYPHAYVSTYCMHELHEQCRKSCKTCHAACLCACHGKPEEGKPDAG